MDLTAGDVQLGLAYGTVDVVDHDPRWLAIGAQLAHQLRDLTGRLAVAVAHVGSTAVPGLAAKPIIDIAIRLAIDVEPEAAIAVLQSAGWTYRGDKGSEGGLLFVAESAPGQRTAHVHVVTYNAASWHNYLTVRDRLRRNPQQVAAYAALKRDLAVRFADDRAAYTAAKADFIARLLRDAES
jgi:GrpB-like predicted nucleotidyltransferase (UPF0157 family)